MGKVGDAVWADIYGPHLNPGRMANNPVKNIQQMLEYTHAALLVELCANRFEWTGLPDTVDVRFLELELCYKGLAVVFKDPDNGELVVAAGSGSGHTNFNGNPVSFTVIGPGAGAGKSITLSSVATRDADGNQVPATCVPVWANYTRRPKMDVIGIYAHRLAKLDRTIEITMDGMRKNKIVKAPENQRQSYVALMRQLAEGQDVIFGTDTLDVNGTVEVLDLGIDPMNLPNLMIARSKLWNECMSLLGINGANQDKKERLVAAEVGANDEQVQAMRYVELNARQTAAAQISELFGTTVTVDFKAPPVLDDGAAPGEEFESGGSGGKNSSDGTDQ